MRDQLDRLCEDLHALQVEMQSSIQREEGLLRQTQELAMVVDEQTLRLKERDQELSCLESSMHFG